MEVEAKTQKSKSISQSSDKKNFDATQSMTPGRAIRTILIKNFIQYGRGYYFIAEFALLILWAVQILANLLPSAFTNYKPTQTVRATLMATQFMYLMICCSRLSIFTFIYDREHYLEYQSALGINIHSYTLAWYIFKLIIGIVQMIFVMAIFVGLAFAFDFQVQLLPGGLITIFTINSIIYLAAIAFGMAFTVFFSNFSYMVQAMTLFLLVNYSSPFFFMSPVRASYNITANQFSRKDPSIPSLFLDNIQYDYITVACQFIVYSLIFYFGTIIRFKLSLSYDKIIKNIYVVVSKFKRKPKSNDQVKQQTSELIPMDESQRYSQKDIILDHQIAFSAFKISLIKKDKAVLRNISLDIKKNESLCLYGKNGSGKSLLIKVMAKVGQPTSGSINYNFKGNNLIGVCLQENYLYADLTVTEQLRFYGGIKGISKIEQAVDQILNTCELFSQRVKKYNELSGGNQRKLSLACALIGSPKILFLDEPTIGLDTKSKHKIWSMIQNQKKKKMSIILATSDFQQMNRLADRIAILQHGQLIQTLTLKEMLDRNQQISLLIHFAPSENKDQLKKSVLQIINQAPYKDIVQNTKQFNQLLEFRFLKKDIEIVNVLMKLILEKHKECEISYSTLKIDDQCTISKSSEEARTNHDKIFKSLQFLLGYQSKVTFWSCLKAQFIKKFRTTIYSPQSILILIVIIGVYFCYPIAHSMQQFYLWGSFHCDKTKIQEETCESQYGLYLFDSIILIDQLISLLLYYYFFTVCSNMVENKQKKFKFISNAIGMGNLPYILANFLFDWVLIFIVYLLAGICTLIICAALDKFYTNLFVTSMPYVCIIVIFQLFPFIAISYLLSMFYSKAYTVVSSVSFVLWFTALAVYDLDEGFLHSQLSLDILSYFSWNQTTSLLMETPQIFGNQFYLVQEYFKLKKRIYDFTDTSFWFYIGGFCFQTFLWFLLIFLIEFCMYKYKTKSTNIDIAKIKHKESEELLQEKYALMDLKEPKQLCVTKLYKKYRNGFISVKDVNLLIEEGQILGLLGPNGSGKSSTFSLLTTEISRTTGKIVYKHQNTNQFFCNNAFQRVGICPQFDYLYDRITVESHILFIARLKGVQKIWRALTIETLLKYFEMENCYSKEISKLSNGERKKLMIITSFIGNPKIIYFDEPTVGLDLISRERLYLLIKYLSSEFKTSFIITTHNVLEAELYCKRIGILVKGELVHLNSPSIIINEKSRGYKLKMICTNAKNMLVVKQLVQKQVKVFECLENNNRLELLFNFPKEFFNFLEIYTFVYNDLYLTKLIQKFQLKRESLEEVAARIANLDRSDFENENETEMNDLSVFGENN